MTYSNGRLGTIYPYFVCIGRHQKRSDCQLKARRIDVVEALVVQCYLHVQLGAELLDRTQDALLDELAAEQTMTTGKRQRQELRISRWKGSRRSSCKRTMRMPCR